MAAPAACSSAGLITNLQSQSIDEAKWLQIINFLSKPVSCPSQFRICFAKVQRVGSMALQ